MQGYVQVYTGNGKGKTTAAIGLTVRALGAGKRVFIGQFTKGTQYSELKSLAQFGNQLTLRQYGTGKFIFGKPSDEDIDAAQRGLVEVQEAIQSLQYDVIVLDEANIAVHYNLFTVQELIEMIKERADGSEVIITGRYATPELIEFADLVTEMCEVKHYYKQGVQARVGIEK